MIRTIETITEFARPIADFAQPVIVALSVAGLTGAMMAAIGMVADRVLRRRSAATARAN